MEDYQQRMIEEYEQLKDRRNKLERMLNKNIAGTLGFEFNTPIKVLEGQLEIMNNYLSCLKIRAEFEEIELEY